MWCHRRSRKGLGQVAQAGDIVGRDQPIDMGQHGADSGRLGLEAVEAQEGVEPDELPAGLVQPLHLGRQTLPASRSSAL